MDKNEQSQLTKQAAEIKRLEKVVQVLLNRVVRLEKQAAKLNSAITRNNTNTGTAVGGLTRQVQSLRGP